MTLLRGIVRSGKGDFSFWLAKLESYYTQKTGMKLYPGTLNVHLSNAIFPTPKDAIRLEKEEYGGRVSVSMAPCRIFGRKAFILRTDTDDGSSVTRQREFLRSQRMSGSKTRMGSNMLILSNWMSPDAHLPCTSAPSNLNDSYV